jgi:hypothetical protein
MAMEQEHADPSRIARNPLCLAATGLPIPDR